MTVPADDVTTARNRLLFISFTRLIGLAMIVVGSLILAGRIEWPQFVGYVLIAIGAAETIIIPRLLVKVWRSGGE
ncbi:hypothetical protein [Pontixanthobacter aquaemixtae]|uniref:Uncharacterized protein n=1 Tax=Pontixanthobacter aquaemixtae TaxID=1958940 RepID=A0A844ZNY0_9SPHN|nr:hypothetical protein [Pontixanthobacter aquaemixtae]MXO89458.1 hypothetical protein [Pontixanthobacter aquaemixtae]